MDIKSFNELRSGCKTARQMRAFNELVKSFASKTITFWVVGLKKDGSILNEEVVGNGINKESDAKKYIEDRNEGISKIKVFKIKDIKDAYEGSPESKEYANSLK